MLEYSFGWDAELQRDYARKWTGMMASQKELLAYAEHVAQRFNLERDIDFNTTVVGCRWDGAAWAVRAADGRTLRAQFLVTCVGCLSEPNKPDIPGVDDFEGPTHFTSRYPHEGIDFAGKRVGVIGTGSSGIQSIPEIAKHCGKLTVFQRTAQYTLPANHKRIPDKLVDAIVDK